MIGILCAISFSISFQSFCDNLSPEFPFVLSWKIIDPGFNLHPKICPYIEVKWCFASILCWIGEPSEFLYKFMPDPGLGWLSGLRGREDSWWWSYEYYRYHIIIVSILIIDRKQKVFTSSPEQFLVMVATRQFNLMSKWLHFPEPVAGSSFNMTEWTLMSQTVAFPTSWLSTPTLPDC